MSTTTEKSNAHEAADKPAAPKSKGYELTPFGAWFAALVLATLTAVVLWTLAIIYLNIGSERRLRAAVTEAQRIELVRAALGGSNADFIRYEEAHAGRK